MLRPTVVSRLVALINVDIHPTFVLTFPSYKISHCSLKLIAPSVCITYAGIVVGVRMLHGDLEQVRKEEPVLMRGIAITRKLGFSDVIMPGMPPYITLLKIPC